MSGDYLPGIVSLSLSEAVRDSAELPLAARQTDKFFAATGHSDGETHMPAM